MMKFFKLIATSVCFFFFMASFVLAQSSNSIEYLVFNNNPKLIDKTFRSIESSVGSFSVVERTRHFIGIKFKRKSLLNKNACGLITKSERKARLQGQVIVRRLSRNCEQNTKFKKLNTPDDDLLSYQWHLSRIGAFDGWDKTTGSHHIVIATIDTGTKLGLDDLSENLWTNPNEIEGNGIDDDGNGVIDDLHGYNAAANSGNPDDIDGHGTAVASVIGGVGNNGFGMCGTAWKTKILSVRVSDNQGNMSLSSIIKAIDYVIQIKTDKQLRLKAINASWGGYSYSSILYNAIQRAQNAGILFVAAAGNETNNNDSHPMYPASFNLTNIISTAATDSQGQLSSFSNFGATTVDIAAPGSDIVAIYKTPDTQDFAYYFVSGTSFSAPIVSGLVSLLGSYSANLTSSEIRDAVLNGAAFRSSLAGKVATSGEVNVNSSLALVPNNPVETPSPSPTPTLVPATPTPIVLRTTPTPVILPTSLALNTCRFYGKIRRSRPSLSSSKMPDPLSFNFVFKVTSFNYNFKSRFNIGKAKKFNIALPCGGNYEIRVSSKSKGRYQAFPTYSPISYQGAGDLNMNITTFTVHK